MVADSPQQQADVLLDSLLWPEQPLGWDVAGTPESVAALEQGGLRAYLGRQYIPNNAVVSVAGDISHQEVVEAVAAATEGWQPGVPASWFPALDSQEAPRFGLLTKRTEQAHLAMAVRSLPSHHPDRYALSLLSVILGEGMSSRLFLELRERRGLAYDVHSYVNAFLDTGAFMIYAGVDPSNGPEALEAVLRELALLRHGVPEEELHKARELSKGRLLLRMEDTRSVAGWIGSQEMLWGHVHTPEEVVAALEVVTAEDVRRLAERLFVSDQFCLAVVGPYRSERRFRSRLSL